MSNEIQRAGNAASLRAKLETDQVARNRLLAVANGDTKTVDRAIAMACLAIARSEQREKLEACSFGSIVQCCMNAIELGLTLGDPVRAEAYLIPFAGECKLMPGYRGLIKLARASGEIEAVIANPVCQGDDFWIDYAQSPPFSHKPNWKAQATKERVVGFYAAVRWKSGHTEVHWMTRADVDAVMAGVERKNKGNLPDPWKYQYIQMGCKTVVRRSMRYAPMTAAAEAVMHESEALEEIEPAEKLPPGHSLLASAERAAAYAQAPAAGQPEAAPVPAAGGGLIDSIGAAIDAAEIDRLADEKPLFGGSR